MIKKAKKEKKVVGESIDDTLKSLKNRFGEDSVMSLDQSPIVGVDCIPTGSFGLDMAIGIGGLPRGRITEVYGPESSGKTTLALHVVAEAQKVGGVCAFIDAEHALDPEYAKRIGVNTKYLLVSQPSNGEEALEMVEAMVRSGKFAVIVIDSVAALTPRDEIEGEMGDRQVGSQARMMSQAGRKLVAVVGNSPTVVLFINQVRSSIGMMFPGAPTEFTPGGKALKFYASVRLDIRRISKIVKGEEVVGGRTKVKVVKNKVGAPFKETQFDLMYNEGISREGEILALGEKYGVIVKSGNSYAYGDIKLGVGYEKSRNYLKENKELANEIQKIVVDKLKAPIEALAEMEDTPNA